MALSIAPKIRVENLDGDMNYAIQETRAAIKERIPEETIWGAANERVSSGATQAPEVLVKTVDDDGEVTTPVDADIHQVDMMAMSNKQGVPEDNQDDSQESSNDTPESTTGHRPLDRHTEKIHSRIGAYVEAGGTLPTIQVADLLGRTFISKPDETGEQMWARISWIEASEETSADYIQWMYKFQCKVGDKVFE
jgi:hypothetical protein